MHLRCNLDTTQRQPRYTQMQLMHYFYANDMNLDALIWNLDEFRYKLDNIGCKLDDMICNLHTTLMQHR